MGKRREVSPKHTHHYFKVIGKFTFVWKCADPDCKHFVYGSQEYIVLGRNSYCWNCKKKFEMTETAMQEDMPRCAPCRAGIEVTTDADVDFTEHVEADQIEVYEPDDE
jgi:hypothetical protein